MTIPKRLKGPRTLHLRNPFALDAKMRQAGPIKEKRRKEKALSRKKRNELADSDDKDKE